MREHPVSPPVQGSAAPNSSSPADKTGEQLKVAVAIIERSKRVELSPCIEAIESQDYPIEKVVAVTHSDVEEVTTSSELVQMIEDLDPSVDAVWLLHNDSYPRPDALGALVNEMKRNQAAVVGSKLLRADQPDRLDSIGAATDVYGEPYTGLDPEEIDLEQYDVVRDVSFVLGASMLVRRDLLRGLRGLNSKLPPRAAGLDFSQRARLAGGRVMVAPSSEVLHVGVTERDTGEWREMAGQLQAIMIAYRWLTLLWVLPVGAVIYLLDALTQLAWGRFRPLWRWFGTIGWNIWHLPDIILTRTQLRPLRVVKDEELFRYQVSGSVRVRQRLDEISDRFGVVGEGEDEDPSEQRTDRLRFPLAAVLAMLVMLGATRTLWWEGLPLHKMVLPFSDHPGGVLAGFAGGWNPTGLGSAEPIHPNAALAALSDLVLFGWGQAEALVTVAALVLGMVGMARWLLRIGVGPVGSWAGGLAAVLGPLIAWAGQSGSWATVVGLSTLPWALDAAFRSWPVRWRSRFGRLGIMTITMGPPVLLVPWSAVIPLVVAVLMLPTHPNRWAGSLRCLWLAVVGMVFTAPYWLAVDIDQLTSRSWVDFSPGGGWWGWMGWWIVIAALGLAASLASGRGDNPAGLGAALVGIGALVLWGADSGTELVAVSIMTGALGTGLVIGGCWEPAQTRFGWQSWLRVLTVIGATVLLLPSLAAMVDGRGHLGDPSVWERLDFASSLEPERTHDRMLLISDQEDIFGQSHPGEGYWYRLVSAEGPSLDQALLSDPGSGDLALADVLEQILVAQDLRPAQLLAPFSIRWVVIAGNTPFGAAFSEVVDLTPVPIGPDLTIYQNPVAVQRITLAGGLGSDDSDWSWDFSQAQGTASENTDLTLAEQFHSSWEPSPVAQDWFMQFPLDNTDTIVFNPDDSIRQMAWLGLMLWLLGLTMVGVGWGSKE